MLLDPLAYQTLPGCGRLPRYVVGIDGGGSRTRAVLADPAGRIVGRGEAGPSALGQGAVQAWAQIERAVAQALDGVRLEDCALGLGLSGVGVATQVEAFSATAPTLARGVLISDGLAAVLGAHGGAPGAVLLAGTGSVGEALQADGRRTLVGGWGWAIGDEGSGAWLGRRAVQLAQAAFDGREPTGELARAVWQQCGDSRAALLDWCAAAGQGGFARLAPLVFEHAEQDAAAARALSQAVRELERLAFALDPEQRLPLALGGSIALRLAERFAQPLRERFVQPQGDAASGALLLIQHLIPTNA